MDSAHVAHSRRPSALHEPSVDSDHHPSATPHQHDHYSALKSDQLRTAAAAVHAAAALANGVGSPVATEDGKPSEQKARERLSNIKLTNDPSTISSTLSTSAASTATGSAAATPRTSLPSTPTLTPRLVAIDPPDSARDWEGMNTGIYSHALHLHSAYEDYSLKMSSFDDHTLPHMPCCTAMRHSKSLDALHSIHSSEPDDSSVSANVQHSDRIKGSVGANEPPFTNYTHRFRDCIDYIFYSSQAFSRVRIAPLPRSCCAESENNSLPNAHWPSDHLALHAVFQWQPAPPLSPPAPAPHLQL